ncbi:MAG TPA: hypothetical protein VFG87_23675 [Amycolatopsis sp.]|nr:hypothetical protein [Amycolatopsis sp.]
MAMTRPRMSAGAGESDGPPPPLFAGADRLVELIGALYQRPRAGDRPRPLETPRTWGRVFPREERADRRGLPMVCLVRPEELRARVLPAVTGLLEEAQPAGVRHAYLPLPRPGVLAQGEDARERAGGAEEAEPDPETIRDLLRDARDQLVANTKVRGESLRFDLFTLLVWLMNEEIPAGHDNPDRTLLWRIQRRGLMQRLWLSLKQIEDGLPDERYWKLPLLILRVVTAAVFRIAVTGRVPALSGPYRWFLRQPHLAPATGGSFPRFARRLTLGQWQKEAPEYLCRLLVNAFLEDLRRAYRLRPWKVWRRRRMTYPVLLADDITVHNGGYTLLRLINEVRNQVGLFDPLLVVSGSTDAPPDGGRDDPGRPKFTADKADEAYRAWQKALRDDRRKRRDTTWYLPIRITGEDPGTVEPWWRGFDGYKLYGRQARPPWWASRFTRTVVPVVVVAVAAALVWVGYRDRQNSQEAAWASHCDTGISSLTWVDGECIGYADGQDGSQNLFSPSNDPAIDQVVRTIHQQNQQAEKLHGDNPARPYISLIALQALTSVNGTADGLTTERESLEGVAVAQQRQLTDAATSDPIVRILIANAGKNMRHGADVARQLGAAAQQDKTIVGVIGLDNSSQPTQDTINALTNAGLPMVASTLSADGLADLSPMYFEVAPQNRREADVVAAFADQLGTRPRTVRVYYSDDDSDTYSTNLRDDVVKSFQARNFTVDARAFTPNDVGGAPVHADNGDQFVGNAAAAGRDTCSFDGYVFFAGRGVPDFGDFLDGASQCGSKAVLIGDDDVSRFVADQTARQLNRALPYYYASFATAPVAQPQGVALDFYPALDTLFGFERTAQGRSLDGHAALAFDAAQVMITATTYLRETAATIPPTPGTVWREITAIHTSQPDAHQINKYLEGVSGTIDYGGDITRNVPENKPVAVLRVDGGQVDQNSLAFCGEADGLAPAAWCPTDTGPGS